LHPPTALPSGRRGASWQALGTGIALRVTDARALERAREHVESELAAIDRACSRFRPDSELVRLNASGGQAVRVSALLMEALELALSAAELTGGDVDPTVGRALEMAGAYGPPSDAPPRVTLRTRTGWRTLRLDRAAGAARLPRGIHLDLGATAKAWAADRAANAAAAGTGCGVLVGVGGDIACAGKPPPGGWQVHVTDDHRSDAHAPGQTVAILCGGLATSSTTVRRWQHSGRTLHHIFDPRTGMPADTMWRTVSVAASSCAEANIATTATILRGQDAVCWLGELGLPARLVDHGGRTWHVGEWPAELGGAAAGESGR
jgi:thiamine biosynthesis lipoprotein ApbE